MKRRRLNMVNLFLRPMGMELRRQRPLELTMNAALHRTIARDIPIQTIIDIGASNGSWTDMARRHLPKAHALLIEANAYHQPALERFCTDRAFVEYILAAAGDNVGEIFFAASNPFGGLASHEERDGDIRVPVTTVDHEVTQRNLQPPFLLKLDTHGFEVPILKGASQTLHQTNMIVIETYNFRIAPEGLKFYEMCALLADRGFHLIDLCDVLHRPRDNAFWQFDMIFLRDAREEFQYNKYR